MCFPHCLSTPHPDRHKLHQIHTQRAAHGTEASTYPFLCDVSSAEEGFCHTVTAENQVKLLSMHLPQQENNDIYVRVFLCSLKQNFD